jgi:hypothetical protein
VGSRGLGARGAKLTAEIVAKARRRAAAYGVDCRTLAEEAGVSPSTMRHALNGTTWATVTDPPPLTGRGPGPRVLTTDQVVRARRHIASRPGDLGRLAKEFGVRIRTVENAVYGTTWQSLLDPPPLPRRPTKQPTWTKLDPVKVAKLRRDFAARVASMPELAQQAGVRLATARSAIVGDTWRSVTDPPPLVLDGIGHVKRALNPLQVKELVRLRDQEDLTWSAIAKRLGVSKDTARLNYQRAVSPRRAHQAGSDAAHADSAGADDS